MQLLKYEDLKHMNVLHSNDEYFSLVVVSSVNISSVIFLFLNIRHSSTGFQPPSS